MNEAKYIAWDNGMFDTIIIFDATMTHMTVAHNLCIKGDSVIGAGFVSSNLQCYGESVSLNKKSRNDPDTKLLYRMLNGWEDRDIPYEPIFQNRNRY